MDYKNAIKVHSIIEEMRENQKDIDMLTDATYNGFDSAQITIKSKDGIYNTTIYDHNRINLLLRVLLHRNTELAAQLKAL